MTDLDGWNDGRTTEAILDFVDRVTADGPDYVEPADRIAVFDNDDTLLSAGRPVTASPPKLHRLVRHAQAPTAIGDPRRERP